MSKAQAILKPGINGNGNGNGNGKYAFLNPAKWFSNFKVHQKLLTISLSFLVPISIMFYFILQSVSGYINFATLEQYGNSFQRPLVELFCFIPQHEDLVRRYLEKEEGVLDQILKVQAKLDQEMVLLESVNAKVGVQLQFTDEGLAKRNRSHFRVENVRS